MNSRNQSVIMRMRRLRERPGIAMLLLAHLLAQPLAADCPQTLKEEFEVSQGTTMVRVTYQVGRVSYYPDKHWDCDCALTTRSDGNGAWQLRIAGPSGTLATRSGSVSHFSYAVTQDPNSCSTNHGQPPEENQSSLFSELLDVSSMTASGPATLQVTGSGCYAETTQYLGNGGTRAPRPPSTRLVPEGVSVQFQSEDAPGNPAFEFRLDESAATGEPNDAKFLIALHRDDDAFTYPSQYQLASTGRPKMQILGRVIDGSQGERRIWFKLIDPPDPSRYIPEAERLPNDNKDRAAKLWNAARTISAGYDEILEATWEPDGSTKLILEGTDRYAGDNYKILASFDADFTCETDSENPCSETAIITAWKRVYIETDLMARQGSFITRNSTPSKATGMGTHAYVQQKVERGKRVALIHAPRGDQSSGGEFYGELNTVVAAEKDDARGDWRLTLQTPLQKTYYGPERPRPSQTDMMLLADAVAVVDMQEPFFRPNLSAVKDLYDEMFVEWVVLPTNTTFNGWVAGIDPVSIIPYVERLSGEEREAGAVPQAFAKRWFYNDGKRNHIQMIGANRDGDDGSRQGVTRIPNAHSFVYVGEVARQVLGGTAESRFNSEVVVHELTHQWDTNQTGGINRSHCELRTWDNNHTCTQIYDYGVEKTRGGYIEICDTIPCPEYTDGKVGFHGSPNTPPSEYTWIRQRPEPLPNTKGVSN